MNPRSLPVSVKRFFDYRRTLITVFLLGVVLALGGAIFSTRQVAGAAEGKVFTDLNSIPKRKVGLVLGCSQKLPDGRDNLYFEYRISAAAELYHAGRVRYLLVSGDNSRGSYDEASDMRDALIELGVPEKDIVRDHAGFSTLDSVVRAKKVFLENKLTVISQPFHVRRAIYIAATKDIDLIGYAAKDVDGIPGTSTRIREKLAVVKTVLDTSVLGREPRFYGKTIQIGGLTKPDDSQRPH